MDETILVLHQRSLRNDALETGLCAIVLTGFLILVSVGWMLADLPFTREGVFMLSLGVLFVCALLYFTVKNFRAGGHFRCMLTTERLVCECPLKSAGKSFALAIGEIEYIEEHSIPGSDSDSTCYLRNRNGDKFWLTRNYGNPTAKILDRLEVINPKIQNKIVNKRQENPNAPLP